jgi:transposase
LRPPALEPGPEETARVAWAAFPKGNPYLTLRDALGTIFQDDDFTDLYSHEGQPGLSAWRLALVTLMQFRKGAIPCFRSRCETRGEAELKAQWS